MVQFSTSVRSALNEALAEGVVIEMGWRVWMLATIHIVRLARVHNLPALDEEVLPTAHKGFSKLLNDLHDCWCGAGAGAFSSCVASRPKTTGCLLNPESRLCSGHPTKPEIE
jgi:hypothetical protein